MAVQLKSILNDCLSALQSLLTAKEQFSAEGNQRSVKRLCERTEIFLSALKSLEDPAVATQKEAEFAGLKSVLQSLKKLLSEIQVFVSQYGQESSLSIARKMAVNDEFRSKRAQEISSFNARIHKLRSTLLPAVDESVEKNREEDLEDFRLDMEGMLETVMEELKGLRTNPAELKRYLQEMKQDCSTRQIEILNKLSEVEANVNVSLMDLSDIEQTLTNHIKKGKSIILMLDNLTLLISFSPFFTSLYSSIDTWTPETISL